MKRFGIWLILALFSLVLACGEKKEEKAAGKPAAPPVQGEKVAPQAPPATPAPSTPTPEHPKQEHPK